MADGSIPPPPPPRGKLPPPGALPRARLPAPPAAEEEPDGGPSTEPLSLSELVPSAPPPPQKKLVPPPTPSTAPQLETVADAGPDPSYQNPPELASESTQVEAAVDLDIEAAGLGAQRRRREIIPWIVLVLVIGLGSWGAFHLYSVSSSTADALHMEQTRHELTRQELYGTRNLRANASRRADRAEQSVRDSADAHEEAITEVRASYGTSFDDIDALATAMRAVQESGTVETTPNRVVLTIGADDIFATDDSVSEAAGEITTRLAAVLEGNTHELLVRVHPRGVSDAAREKAATRAAALVEHLTGDRDIAATRIVVIAHAGVRRGSRARVELTLRPAAAR